MTRQEEIEKHPIPTFGDEAEAAAFWDTHSPEDYPAEFEEVQAGFSRPRIKRGLTIKLSDETIQKRRDIAQQKGIGPTTLVRMWILEHLRSEEHSNL